MEIPPNVLALFQTKSEPFKQTLFIDNAFTELNIDSIVESELEAFLKMAYENSADGYINRGVLSIICELVLSGKLTNKYFALNYLATTLRAEEDSFLLTVSIKYYSLISDYKDVSVITLLKELSDNDNGDVASEAFYWLGFKELLTIQYDDVGAIAESLGAARKYFGESVMVVENRVDSCYYVAVIDFILASLQRDDNTRNLKFEEIRTHLFTRSLYEWEKKYLEFDFLIFQFLNGIREQYLSLNSVDTWTDFKDEVHTLLLLTKEMEKLKVTRRGYGKYFDDVYSGLIKHVSILLYQNNLAHEKRRLVSLRQRTDESELEEFLSYIISFLPEDSGAPSENLSLLLSLSQTFGNEKGLVKYNAVKNKKSPDEIIAAFTELKNRNEQSTSGFITGSIQGQEIYFQIISALREYLPHYQEDKMEVFSSILAEVIRYARSTFVGSSKKDYLFLYSKTEAGPGANASETDLQDSLFRDLRLTKLAHGFEHEKAKFTDGGRVDIVFKVDLITIPIEIKKTTERITLERVEQDYIAQAQTYAAGYDQLGIFVLLDLYEERHFASPNFKDWLNIHHLASANGLPVKFPDYIVSVVIPGNRLLPSSKSTYG